MPGIWQSIKIRSNCCPARASRATSPPETTVGSSRRFCNMRETTSWLTGLSSTTRKRSRWQSSAVVGTGVGPGLRRPPEQQCGRQAWRGRNEPESGSAPGLALEAYRAAHEGDQPQGYREAQAGSAVFPGSRAIGLAERAEEALGGVGRDADPGVHDAHEHRGAIPHLRCGKPQRGRCAALRDLDGV